MRKRTVLITGGTRGIGRALVELFAESGFNVAFCYLRSESTATQILERLQKNGVNSLAIKCDVKNRRDAEAMYRHTKACFGFVDTVINNAGIAHTALITDETDEDIDETLAANLKSAINICAIYSKDMVSERFGRIINMSSVWGIRGSAAESVYSAAKAGVIGLTKSLANELAPSGITVNALAPGLIATDMNNCYSDSEISEITKKIPLGRMGSAKDVANAALFLSKEESEYITGQVLCVDGGGI